MYSSQNSRYSSTEARSLGRYDEYFRKLKTSTSTLDEWRKGFASKSSELAADVARKLNANIEAGEGFLKPANVVADQLAKAFKSDHSVYTPDSYRRFTGAAAGDLRLYTRQADKKYSTVKAPVTYSVWAPASYNPGKLAIQKITASSTAYIDPGKLPESNDGKSDLILNVWTPELGLASWSHFFRANNTELRSIGYEMDGGRLIWVNELLTAFQSPVTPIFDGKRELAFTLEYEEKHNGARLFCIYGLHLLVDFEKGTADFKGPVLKIRNRAVPEIGYRTVPAGWRRDAEVMVTAKDLSVAETRVNGVTFLNDGKSVVAGGGNGVARLFQLAGILAGEPKNSMKVEKNLPVTSAAVSLDGKMIVLAHHADPATPTAGPLAVLVDAAFKQTGTLDLSKVPHSSNAPARPHDLTCAVFGPGDVIATASLDGRAVIWDRNGAFRTALSGHIYEPSGVLPAGVWSVVFLKDGHNVATGGSDQKILIWDLQETRTPRHTFNAGRGVVFALDYDARNDRLVSGSEDESVVLWDVKAGKSIKEFSGHRHWVVSAKFSSNGDRILTGSWDGTARIWDVESGTEILSVPHPGAVHAAAFSPDGSHIATGCEDGYLRIFKLVS